MTTLKTVFTHIRALASVKAEIDKLTKEAKRNQAWLLQFTQENHKHRAGDGNSLFYLKETPVYEFSPSEKQMEDDLATLQARLKLAKSREIEDGIAKRVSVKVDSGFRVASSAGLRGLE